MNNMPNQLGRYNLEFDRADRAFACHNGFTEGELDFNLNRDVKYRLSRKAERDDE